MAFDMGCIARKSRESNDVVNVKILFGVVNDMGILSDNVKHGLKLYLKARLKQYGINGLNKQSWQKMIYELLEYCCSKSYKKIGLVDTTANQGEIIYQLKKSLSVGKLKSLYIPDDDVTINTLYSKAKVNPPQRLIRSNIDKAVVEAYFRELEII